MKGFGVVLMISFIVGFGLGAFVVWFIWVVSVIYVKYKELKK